MQDNKMINIDNLITLCHILDDYEEFEKILIKAMKHGSDRDFVFQLDDVSKGKFRLGSYKARRFYEENKLIIDAINHYSTIPGFINLNYGINGKIVGDIRFFYEYLVSHKEDIEKILFLMNKLKELGFDNIEFSDELDFTKEVYKTSLSQYDNFYLMYVANPEVIPNYTNEINYVTKDSKYKMILSITGYKEKEISKYNRKIILNSLIFNPYMLPEKLDLEHTYGNLGRLKEEQSDETFLIRNSVDLNVSIFDLDKQYDSTYRIINGLNDNIKHREELVTILMEIKAKLEKLKLLGLEYNRSISRNDPLLSQELLEQEKVYYLRRRENNLTDL